MIGKLVTADFGYVFPADSADRDQLVRRIENLVQVNVQEIILEGSYKHRMAAEVPLRLKVTVELSGEG